MIPPVSLLANLTLYLPFLHYYDIVSYQSDLLSSSSVLDSNQDSNQPVGSNSEPEKSYAKERELTTHLVGVVTALHGFAHHTYDEAPEDARIAVENAQDYALGKLRNLIQDRRDDDTEGIGFGPLFLSLAKVAQHRFLPSAPTIFGDCGTPPEWNLKTFCFF